MIGWSVRPFSTVAGTVVKGVVKGGTAPRKYLAKLSAEAKGNKGLTKKAEACCVVAEFRQAMILLIKVEPRKPAIVPTGVVGVIAVGIDGRVARSAKATVPFRATFTGQGVV